MYFYLFIFFQVWFKNRRAKWRKQKREEQERLRKMQEEHNSGHRSKSDSTELSTSFQVSNINHFSEGEDSSSDLEVA